MEIKNDRLYNMLFDILENSIVKIDSDVWDIRDNYNGSMGEIRYSNYQYSYTPQNESAATDYLIIREED